MLPTDSFVPSFPPPPPPKRPAPIRPHIMHSSTTPNLFPSPSSKNHIRTGQHIETKAVATTEQEEDVESESESSSDDEAEGAILLEAAEHGSVAQVKRIIRTCEGDADVITACDFEHRTALHLASLETRPIVLKVLLENKSAVASVNRRDMFGCTPLLLVCVKPGNELKKIKCAELLIHAGAEVQCAWTKEMLNRTCLHWCAFHGYPELAELLVHHDQSKRVVRMHDYKRRLPMDVAGCELMEIKHLHLEKGSSAGRNDVDHIKRIQQIKARERTLKVLMGGGRRGLRMRRGSNGSINSRLLEGSTVASGRTIVGVADDGPPIRVLQSQLCWGAYLDWKDMVSKTLHYAAKRVRERKQTIRYDWSHIYGQEGMTALHFAALMGSNDVIDVLVAYHRLHYQPKNNSHQHQSTHHGHSNLIPTPMCGADHRGNYPLHLAAMYSNFPHYGPTDKTVSRLLSSGADPTLLNADGRTPASYARGKVRHLFSQINQCYDSNYVKDKNELSYDYIIRFQLLRECSSTNSSNDDVTAAASNGNGNNNGNGNTKTSKENRGSGIVLELDSGVSYAPHKLTKTTKNTMKEYLIKKGFVCSDTMDQTVCLLMVTASNTILRQHAERLQLKLPVLGERKNMIYSTDRAWVFEPLRSREKIEIIKAVIGEEYDLNVFKQSRIVLDSFPIHEETELEGVRDSWIRGCCPDPWNTWKHLLYEDQASTLSGLTRIATYFGEEKAMYFGFVSFYALYLGVYLVPAGVLLSLYQMYQVVYVYGLNKEAIHNIYVPLFACYVGIWATLVIEKWKRKASELSFRWDTTNHRPLEVTRSEFKGPELFDEVENQVHKHFTTQERCSRAIFGSPLWLLSLIVIVIVQVIRINFKHNVANQMEFPKNRLYSVAGSCVQGAIIAVLNIVYRRVAIFLTKWENYQTESQFQDALIFKIFIFQAINGNLALVHAAFVDKDAVELWTLLIVLMAGVQISNTAKQLILPKIKFCCRLRKKTEHRSKALTAVVPVAERKDRSIEGKEHRENKQSKKKESKKKKSTETNNDKDGDSHQSANAVTEVLRNCAMNSQSSIGLIGDYAEMVSQFTYIVLWSAVFPLAPLFAVLVNYTQLRGEMSLACDNMKRNDPEKADNIGAWLPILETVSMAAVVSNTVLIVHTFNSRLDFEESFNHTVFKTDLSYFWLVAAIEHLVIVLKLILSYWMDDVPAWVNQLKKVEDARSRRKME